MRRLTIATDCSGIEAPIQALKQMKIPYRHLWSCDNDKYVKQSIEANYKPEHFYEDMTQRDLSSLPADDLDLYVCGFPCQPFSLMGNKLGTNDKRGNIMMECVAVIKKKLPKVFILENVKNFKSIQQGRPYNYLMNQLENISGEQKDAVYNVYSHVLNTRDYGIPQNRERVFIVGIRKDMHKIEYKIPKKKICQPLSKFLVDAQIHAKVPSKSLNNNLKKVKDIDKHNYIVTPFTFYSAMKEICPTISTNCAGYYHSKLKRNVYPQELLMLQGFPNTFKKVVSKTQFCKQIGNSMSVCVLKAILKEILRVSHL